MATRTLRVLTIGHAYVVGLNRATVRHIAQDAAFDITVAAPRIMKDELRTIEIESEPGDSQIRLVAVDTYLTRTIPFLTYNPSQIKRLLDGGNFLMCFTSGRNPMSSRVTSWHERRTVGRFRSASVPRKTSSSAIHSLSDTLRSLSGAGVQAGSLAHTWFSRRWSRKASHRKRVEC